jgi:type I restriction-modification system DNA methylase subunit
MKMSEEICRKHVWDWFGNQRKDYPKMVIEPEKSKNPKIQKLLKKGASKTGGSGPGRPDLIISGINDNLLFVVECKADINKHKSKMEDKYAEYAVDGVKNYMSYLSKGFDVVGLAVSGQPNYYKVSTFLQLKGDYNVQDLKQDELKDITQYINAVCPSIIREEEFTELMKSADEIHHYLRNYAKLSEAEKPLLVAGILIALKSERKGEKSTFETNFNKHSYASHDLKLAVRLYEEIEKKLESDLKEPKLGNMLQPFSFITTHPVLANKDNSKRPLLGVISLIVEKVRPFLDKFSEVDVVGHFYGEFLKYTAGDKKGLGIVLTPRHICELFMDLIEINENSRLLDTCCGTAGFLIAGMESMKKLLKDAEEKIPNMKGNQLIGVEMQPQMFALAASNMIFRGDGKANLYLNDCFKADSILKKHKCNRGAINPPYNQKSDDGSLDELAFVKHMLDQLEVDSLGAAIIPMSCVVQSSEHKERLLKKHTLIAVMSMPNDLFYPVGVVTCIIVFKAKQAHPKGHKTWFAYWKDDGHEKTKKNGRMEITKGRWKEVRTSWLYSYDKKIDTEISLNKEVTAKDEWCVEAYMETDYSTITQNDFDILLRGLASWRVKND